MASHKIESANGAAAGVADGAARSPGLALHGGEQAVSAKRKGDDGPSLEVARPGLPATTAAAAYFLPYQAAWIKDESPLRICEKGRQIGLSYADSYDSVRKAAVAGGRDVWVGSRDELQAKEYIRYCKRWANILNYAAEDFGEQVFTTEDGKAIKVQVLQFASGKRIHALSSNPDAFVGKSGAHVKLDEYAIHKDQRQLLVIAKPVIQWGGTMSVISTHRGVGTVFNQIVTEIKERGNKMGWSLHTIPIQRAVEDGLVERIDAVTGGGLTKQFRQSLLTSAATKTLREWWLAKQRAECLDEEQWLQEYCCIPADEASAFISYEMINGAEAADCLRDWAYLEACENPLYVGLDVARKKDLCVFDIGERVGDVMWDRMRLELRGKKFSEIEWELNRIMGLRQVKRLCGDATGMGMQLMERAGERWGYRCEAVTFTGQVKEDLAFGLRQGFEDSKLRIAVDDKLKADLRGIKKEVTAAGNIRFVGDSEDSHCDRFWAKALRQHAVSRKTELWSALV